MKKIIFGFTIVSALIFGLFTFSGKNAEASSLDLQQQEELEQYKEENNINKRAATDKEFILIDKTIKVKMKDNPDVTVEEVLKELGLEDIGYEEAEDANSALPFSSDPFIYSNEGNQVRANIGTMGFRGGTSNSTRMYATLQVTQIGTSKLDHFSGWVTPYTKASNGAFVANGASEGFVKNNLKIGTTVIGQYSALHSKRGAKLTATGYMIHKGKQTLLAPASVVYTYR